MKEGLAVFYQSRVLLLTIETVYRSNQVARYRIAGKNRAIVLQCNIPYLESVGKKGMIKWKLIEGEMHSDLLMAAIIRSIEKKWRKEQREKIENE